MSTIRIVSNPVELRAALVDRAPGLVPTMGALHDGHRALIERCARENELTVVSVFVNPTQFTSQRDLTAYPRDLPADAEIVAAAGADLLYAPDAMRVYPAGFQTFIDPGPLATRWEGESRPGHFRGVATVVAILLNTVQPVRAYFGEKDYQQLCVVRQMSRDLLLPGEVTGCPTVRADDGLALSSRNAMLSPEDRQFAVAVPDALYAIRAGLDWGETRIAQLLEGGRAVLERTAGIEVEYLALVHPETLEPLIGLTSGARAIVAVKIGGVRLIDNLQIVD